MSTQPDSNKDDIKSIFDLLSRTLQYGDRIQEDKLRSDEEKKQTLNEIREKIKVSMNRHEELKSEQNEINRMISDLKIRIQDGQNKLNEKLLILERAMKSFNKIKAIGKHLDLLDELQSYFLKSINNIILALRDYDVRHCRNQNMQDSNNLLIDSIDLNEVSDDVLDRIEKQIDDVINDVISIINRIDNKRNENELKIFKNQLDLFDEQSTDQLLPIMESLLFDYQQFNF